MKGTAMKKDKTRITIRIEKDLLTEFKKIFPYRGELTGFLTRCMENVCKFDYADVGLIKRHIIRGR